MVIENICSSGHFELHLVEVLEVIMPPAAWITLNNIDKSSL
jgi:hypothetical protein